jgi:hypothetical protein
VNPAAELRWLAFRLRLERAAGYWVTCIGGGAAAAGLLHHWIPLAAGNLIGLAVALAADRFRRIGPHDVALHLDRELPQFEESTTLLLAPADALHGLSRLQRDRIGARWDSGLVQRAIPRRELRRGLLTGAALALLGLVLSRLPLPPAGATTGPPTTLPSGSGVLAVRALEVEILPPAYTRAPKRRSSAEDLEVEEGARITWLAELHGPVRAAWLRGTSGDSLPLRHAGGVRWTGELRAARSQLWRLELTGPDTARARSGDIRLVVRPDRPPVLTVLRPGERTILEPTAIAPVAVELLATDDYGVDSAGMNVTIATGRGEAVRFRRLRLPFASRVADGGTIRLRATLDLPALGLGPGDELYFVADVTDHREPVPNRSRSGTIFLSVVDTAQPPTADLARMALTVQPEYFRSQRQIIIDTEQLLADQPHLSVPEFRQRANDLGMDQGLLRLRYGQFLGEEFETQAGDAAEEHAHDDPENATLLGQAVKDKLRAAISAMWQAELYLRTAEPRTALPYEYRALEMLKQVQQDARVYVQRVGFEPPPIEVARLRLTGSLKDLAGLRRADSSTTRDTLPAIRAALQGLTRPGITTAELGGLLELAGRELAGLAVEDPAHLGAVRDLRRYSDALASGTSCDGCAARVARGFQRALPPPAPATPPEPRGVSVVGRRFEALLREAAP